jgi:flagellar protein FlaF
MHHATKAYGAIAKQTASPRKLEADLLLDAAARLQAVRERWEEKRDELDAALTNNRRLWSIFLTSATSADNPLPVDLRQNVANLGIFIFNETLSIQANPRPEALAPLININRRRGFFCWATPAATGYLR